MTPQEADYLLAEWARWSRGDVIRIGYPRACAFGLQIKPDPSPSREPVDDARALRTDHAIAALPGRARFLLKLHYLDGSPTDVKALRLRMGRKKYLARVEGVQKAFLVILDRQLCA